MTDDTSKLETSIDLNKDGNFTACFKYSSKDGKFTHYECEKFDARSEAENYLSEKYRIYSNNDLLKMRECIPRIISTALIKNEDRDREIRNRYLDNERLMIEEKHKYKKNNTQSKFKTIFS
jgi:hypothetical protein